MKKIALLSVVLFVLTSLAQAATSTSAQTTLTIKGMTCGGCVGAVKIQLKRTDGVSAFDVSYEKGEASVTYDPTKTEPGKIAASVSKTGFEATVKPPTEAQKAK